MQLGYSYLTSKLANITVSDKKTLLHLHINVYIKYYNKSIFALNKPNINSYIYNFEINK